MQGYSSYNSVNPGVAIGTSLIEIAVAVIILVGMWKMYVKAGRPGWAAIIPIYNLYVLLKIVGQSGWGLLLFFIPFVNIIYVAYVEILLARVFGKSALFGFFLNFLIPFIGPLILGLGSATYKNPKATPAPVVPPPQPVTPPPAPLQ